MNPIDDFAPKRSAKFPSRFAPVWDQSVGLRRSFIKLLSLPFFADTRLVGRSQDRSNQGNTDEVGFCWLIRVREWGEAEQKKECDHATSLCSGASSDVCRDLLLALHADDPASGFARRAGPGCAPSGNSSYEDTA